MTKKWDRVLIFGLLLAVILSMAAGFDNECETVRENVLRLHILANSDSEEDQALKLRVRDAILRETAEDFAKSESQIETMARAEELLPKMKAVAEEALARAGSADAVRVALVNMYFETREYDGTILPAGYYDAVRIELGAAEGHNWWCVLFPQLCIGTAKRADQYAKGVDAAEEVLPGIKNDLLLGKFKPRETDVAAVARASPEERREKAEQLRVIPEKKPKADKESARSGTKRRQEVYATIDKSYEDMKDSKRVTEDSALVSLRYTARNMVETCDVLFTNFPGLLEKPDYKDQVIEIMQEPKQYILKLEGETDNEQHENTLQADGGQQPGFGDSRCVPAQAEHRACGKDRGRVQ